MSTESNQTLESFIAGADLSSAQDSFVAVNSSGQVVLCGDGALARGVVKNKPASGAVASVATKSGYKVKVRAGGAVAAGDSVASNASGKAVTAATNDNILGEALEAASAEDEFFTMLFAPNGTQA